MNARAPIPHPDDIAAAFFIRTRGLDQRQIDWLIRRHGVPVLALAEDGDSDGWAIGSAKVEKVGRRFEFRPEDGDEALIVVARDELGHDLDLVAWSPRGGWTAPWIGNAGLLGLQDLLSVRFVDPLAVRRDFLSWLRADRTGIVILDQRVARRELAGLMLQAEDLEHGLALRRLLEGPPPRIVVPTSPVERAAA